MVIPRGSRTAADATDDFFRSRLDAMIDLMRPLAILSTRQPYAAIEAAVAPNFDYQALPTKRLRGAGFLDDYEVELRGGQPGRPPVPARAPDGQPAVPAEQLQLGRRGTRRTLGRDRAVAVLQRHG